MNRGRKPIPHLEKQHYARWSSQLPNAKRGNSAPPKLITSNAKLDRNRNRTRQPVR